MNARHTLLSTQIAPRRSSRGLRRAVPRAHRRGLVTGLLVVSIVFLAGFIALGLNTARLLHIRAELRAVCQAAALAGAGQLLDEGRLYGFPDQRDDVLMAREAARLLGRCNRVDGRFVYLNPNPHNFPLGDIVVGSIEPLAPVPQALGLPTDPTNPQNVNTVRVTARLTEDTHGKIWLWLGKITGVFTANPACSAQATLDCRIVGFRPERNVKVPVVPLAAEYLSWMRQATAQPIAGLNDCFTVNYQTGQVTPGPDGIPELVLACDAPPAPVAENTDDQETTADAETETVAEAPTSGWCTALNLYNDLQIPYVWPVRCREGLSLGDLQGCGGQMVLVNGVLPMPTLSGMPQELPYGLMDIVGVARAWPLYEGQTGGESPSCSIIDFAAGRIVAVRPSSGTQNNAWEIVVQPATLVCGQAVTSPLMIPNPWIGKLELTQ